MYILPAFNTVSFRCFEQLFQSKPFSQFSFAEYTEIAYRKFQVTVATSVFHCFFSAFKKLKLIVSALPSLWWKVSAISGKYFTVLILYGSGLVDYNCRQEQNQFQHGDLALSIKPRTVRDAY